MILPAPVNGNLFQVNSPEWSLFMEFLINIVFALVLWKLSLRALAAVVLLSALAFLSAILFYGNAFLGPRWTDAAPGLLRVCFSFALGVLFARLHTGKRLKQSYISVFLLLGFMAVLSANVPGKFEGPYDSVVIFGVLPILLWLGSAYDMPERLQPLASMLGDISYPLYAIHFPVLQVIDFAARHYFHIAILPTAIAAIFSSIALSWLLLTFYDEPVRAYLRGKRKPHRPARPAADELLKDQLSEYASLEAPGDRVLNMPPS
jgi:peptidoglycan/LPS O-acetylase OafA/YrhL